MKETKKNENDYDIIDFQEKASEIFQDEYNKHKVKVQNVQERWKIYKILNPPTYEIMDYFGTKIAMFFDYMSL